MDLSNEYLEKYNTFVKSVQEKTPVENNQEKKTTEKAPVNNSDLELAAKFYDFNTLPPLKCTFLGAGEPVKFSNLTVNTWLIADENGYQWFIPQWLIFNQKQNNFLGFQEEKPNDGHVYLITYKGKKQLPNNGTQHICEVLKKIPYGK